MDRLGVLFLTNYLPVGGFETHLLYIVRELDRRAFHPVVCTLKAGGPLEAEFRAAGVPVYSRVQRGRLDPFGVLRLARIMRRERIHLLDVDLQRNTVLIGALAAWLAGVPAAVISAHSFEHMNRERVVEWPARVSLGRIDRVIALFEAHREKLVSEGVDRGKVILRPNGVDTDAFRPGPEPEPLRRTLDIPAGAPVAGIVASLVPLKAHEVFLDVAARVLREHPDAHFLVVGEGPERPRLEENARRAGLQDAVHFLGQRRDLADLFRLMDVAVLTSLWECFPISILEAMACGIPTVTTRVGALPDMAVEGETGFLLEVGDTEGLAGALTRLMGDPDLHRRMGNEARRRVEEHFSIEKIVREREDLYRRLVEEKLAGRTRTA